MRSKTVIVAFFQRPWHRSFWDIKYAVKIAKPNDIIVLAGKGHETYQILKDATIHLDEREVVREALDEL